MCRRDTTDPLLRVMLDRYGLHLLSVPRANAAVGDLYVRDESGISAPGNVRHLLTPPLVVEADQRSERMADISGEVTSRLDASASLGFLEGLLAALGAAALVQDMKLAFVRDKVRTVRFSFSDVTRDSVDVLDVGKRIWRHHVDPRHGLFGPDHRYFLATATTRTDAVTVVAERSDGLAPSINVSALGASVNTGVTVERSSRGELTFHTPEALVFGIELHELVFDGEARVLRLKTASRPMVLRGEEREPVVAPAVLQTPSDSLLLDVR